MANTAIVTPMRWCKIPVPGKTLSFPTVDYYLANYFPNGGGRRPRLPIDAGSYNYTNNGYNKLTCRSHSANRPSIPEVLNFVTFVFGPEWMHIALKTQCNERPMYSIEHWQSGTRTAYMIVFWCNVCTVVSTSVAAVLSIFRNLSIAL